MKLHTSTLTLDDIYDALNSAKKTGRVAEDVFFVQLKKRGSNSRFGGYLIHLGTYEQGSGPTTSRHRKNSGKYGPTTDGLWAASYDEWGWFIAGIFDRDPEAIFGQYQGRWDFNRQTDNKYLLQEEESSHDPFDPEEYEPPAERYGYDD
ncbi:MAG: hypothetical protein JRN42_08185 [Nitrososphaerota archaeon]|nr:hypothetical protein [Nitrososphaerota archaeon]